MEILLIAAAAVILIILIFFDRIRDFLSKTDNRKKLPKAEAKQPPKPDKGVTDIKLNGYNKPRK